MPFIGNQPALSYTSFAKQDFTTSATTSYTLDNPVANANELALFINFVRQEPTTAYSASGTSLTLTSATSATDDMYCVFLGKAVQTVNPPNGSVGISQLSATGTKDATTFLRGDNTFAAAGGGITEADMFRLTASQSGGTNADITTNLERVDDATFSKIGTGMSLSSGIYTFPSTGLYEVTCSAMILSSSDTNSYILVNVSSDSGSSYDEIFRLNNGDTAGQSSTNVMNSSLVNVTNASTFRIKFTTSSMGGSSYVMGETATSYTMFKFIRLGDSQ